MATSADDYAIRGGLSDRQMLFATRQAGPGDVFRRWEMFPDSLSADQLAWYVDHLEAEFLRHRETRPVPLPRSNRSGRWH